MIRIQLSSVDTGATPITFKYNPNFYDAQDSPVLSQKQLLHGATIWQKKVFDGRPRILRWEGSTVSDVKFSAMVTYFRSIKGQIRYIKFNDLSVLNNRWPSASTWKKCRIIGINAEYKKGGSLVYSSFELHIKPEQV